MTHCQHIPYETGTVGTVCCACNARIEVDVRCPDCDGTGRDKHDEPCRWCEQTGVAKWKEAP